MFSDCSLLFVLSNILFKIPILSPFFNIIDFSVVFDMLHQLLDNTGYILYYKDMTGKELMKHLKQHGWVLDRIKGFHHIFIKGSKTIPVPVHGSKDIPIGTVKNIFRLAAIEEEI